MKVVVLNVMHVCPYGSDFQRKDAKNVIVTKREPTGKIFNVTILENVNVVKILLDQNVTNVQKTATILPAAAWSATNATILYNKKLTLFVIQSA